MRQKIIGIIGCGAIGSALAEYAEKNMAALITETVLYDIDARKAEALSGKLRRAGIAGSLEEAVDKADLVIEAASARIVPDLLRAVFDRGKDAMVMSVGGLLRSEDLLGAAREKGITLVLPSGAVPGIDALKAADIAGIESVTLTTRKGPESIKGAPYLSEKGIDVKAITGEDVVFEGNALEAMRGFPKNINVSALLSIAGIGAERTRVRIVVSPAYTRNIHEIEVRSKAGIMTMRTENVPSPDNPRTSYLAVLAAVAALKGYFDTVRIGT
ncbi:MAG: aspartate dehydrogenase [Candidatus Makaraimicrobium thalassicum]|nr:MAG: aspartate dehydrogenase [Candidatus Omnitrophota bacterium]